MIISEMASACVNNIGMSPENFLDCPAYPSYGWLSPRISFSRDEESKNVGRKASSSSPDEQTPENPPEKQDLEVSGKDVGDFEFRLEDPVIMLPADELFSDGKLIPLQLGMIRSTVAFDLTESVDIRSPEMDNKPHSRAEVSSMDQYLSSPKAPRCSSRWRELLGLKKIQNNSNKQDGQETTSLPSKNLNPKSLKYFMHRNSKSPSPADSLLIPLLKESDAESISISSRLSLSSSSSSGPDHEEQHRFSLDSDKTNLNPNPNPNPIAINKNPPKVRVVKPRAPSENQPRPFAADHPTSPMRRAPDSSARGVSIDSPRMNSSGKIVFQSLERSSSSPSTFNGGPRIKHKGMERSYSANVRVRPVLNVPVCSLRGSSKSGSVFGLFASAPKKDRTTRSHSTRNRSDRS